MIQKFFRNQRYRKQVKRSSEFILEEFAVIVNNKIIRLEKEHQVKSPLHKEALKFESTALVLWLFRGNSIFPEPLRTSILDEVHNQYYRVLKRHGYNSNAVQAICDDLNLRYRTYDNFNRSTMDLEKIVIAFLKFVDQKSGTGLDVREILIPAELIKSAADKIKEFHKVIEK